MVLTRDRHARRNLRQRIELLVDLVGIPDEVSETVQPAPAAMTCAA
jgi:uncharacterized heparinase superfamily protein